jgi:hypothetical protein
VGVEKKKNPTLLMKEALVDLDEASRFSDCEVDLSTEEVMAAEDVPYLQRLDRMDQLKMSLQRSLLLIMESQRGVWMLNL